MLKGKKIIVCISGGIAAYKTLYLIRLLVSKGAEVRVACTKNALNFVTPLSIETLSGNSLYSDVFQDIVEHKTEHISFAYWGDLMVVAPATANIISKFANGIADDAVSTLFLAFNKPILLAPAMNVNMYEHRIVQSNMETLKKIGIEVMDAEEGSLVCGIVAKGRMPEPESILSRINLVFSRLENDFLRNKKVLLTSGGSIEPIDPVRFISNRSTGKMGACIADALVEKGAEVSMICTHTAIEPIYKDYIKMYKVETAAQMFEVTNKLWSDQDMGILTAAVADYTPIEVSTQKIKKTDDNLILELKKTEDILKMLGSTKRKNQILVGFALETENEVENAKAKLKNKNLDLIVLNSLKDEGAGFEHDTNKVSFIDKDGKILHGKMKSKKEVAYDLLSHLRKFLVLLCLCFIGFTPLTAQELDCKLTVNTANTNTNTDQTALTATGKAALEELERLLLQFVNARKWSNFMFKASERIPCNITIDIQSYNSSTGEGTAYLSVYAGRPVFNSSYSSTLLNIMDRDLRFRYLKGDPIDFTDNSIGDDLSASLAFYAYIILGVYFDSFGSRSGELFFNKARHIVTQAQSLDPKAWQAGSSSTRNRYWIAENFTNGNYAEIHDVLYTYHRQGLDLMYEDENLALENIVESLEILKKLDEKKSNLHIKQLFMEAKVDELVNLFSVYNEEEKQKIVDLLSSIDPSNIVKYRKIKAAN